MIILLLLSYDMIMEMEKTYFLVWFIERWPKLLLGLFFFSPSSISG